MNENGSPLIVNGELVLYGYVGDPAEYGWGFNARDVLEALAELDGDITVRINSGGGSAWDGVAIYQALKGYAGGQVTVQVDAIAASAASVIAMSGAKIVVPATALMMIHNASGITWGEAIDHEKTAKVLRTLDGQMATLYAERSGQDADTVANMMDEETWLTGDQAVELGFADEVGEAPETDDEDEKTTAEAVAPAAFAYDVYQNTPERIAACAAPDDHRERLRQIVTELTVPASTVAAPAAPLKQEVKLTKKTTAAPTSVDDKSVATEAVKGERARAKGIRQAVAAAKLGNKFADELVESGVSLETAREKIIDALADKDDETGEVRNVQRVEVTADGRDRWRQGVQRGIMARIGLDGGERNEFSAMTMMELARNSLEQRNITAPSQDRMAVAGTALNPMAFGAGHSTDDFTEILSNVAHLSMLRGWDETPETFSEWTSRGTLGDFKPVKRVDLNVFPSLLEVPEGAEYQFATMGERAEQIVLATYGRKFSITRQAIVNDDLGMFDRVPRKMGRASRRTIGNMVYAVLTDNNAMSDGDALFHANHNNLATTGLTEPNVSNVSKAKAAMATHKDPDDNATALNIRAAYMLVPVAIEDTANVLMASEFDPGVDKRKPNPHRGFVQVVSEARLDANSATAWYLAANGNTHDTIEVSYLDGNDQPVLERRVGWDVDGVDMKVRIDVGVKALDFRGLYKNPGA